MMAVGLKPGVKVRGLRPEMALAMTFAAMVCQRHDTDFIVTSVCDGAHSRGSLHYKGLAFDMRTRNMTVQKAREVKSELKDILGAEYDVVLETDHIHCEYDPKEG